jgi:23S rRNA (uracil1939-C5)-methyltransferase
VRPIKNADGDKPEDAKIAAGSNGATKGEPKLEIGYFRANSTALCSVTDCSIVSPLLLKTLLSLREALAAGVFPRTLREVEAFSNADDSKLLLTLTFAGFPSRAAELAEKVRGVLPDIESVLFFDPTRERMELFGPGFLEYEAEGSKYRVGHFSFFQVNRFLVNDLAREVCEREENGRLALDLFAGVGLFSIPLARRFERVVAVESNPAATRDLEANVRSGGSIEVRTADVDRFLERYKEKPDLIVLDPPRAGLEPDTVRRLARIAPPRITYVSCEPPTLARDLMGFREAGYDISEVHLFDLFPQTFHMEAVVRLKRRI